MSTYPEEFSRLEEENKNLRQELADWQIIAKACKLVNREFEAENKRLRNALNAQNKEKNGKK